MSGIGSFLGNLGKSGLFGLGGMAASGGSPSSFLGGMGQFGGLGLLMSLLGKQGGDGGTQSAPVAAQTPVASDPNAIPGMDDINASLARNAALGQQNGMGMGGMNAARFALSSGNGMAGLGAGLGSLLGRLGVRF